MSHKEQSPGHKIFTPTDVDLCACVIWCIWKCMVCDKRHMQNITMIFLIKLFNFYDLCFFFTYSFLFIYLAVPRLNCDTWDF